MPAFSAATSAIALRGIGSSKSFERRGAFRFRTESAESACARRPRKPTPFSSPSGEAACHNSGGAGGDHQHRSSRNHFRNAFQRGRSQSEESEQSGQSRPGDQQHEPRACRRSVQQEINSRARGGDRPGNAPCDQRGRGPRPALRAAQETKNSPSKSRAPDQKRDSRENP